MKVPNFLILLAIVVSLSITMVAKSEAQERVRSLAQIANSNLKFIANSQVKRPDGIYVAGEWRAQIYASLFPIIIGVGNPFDSDEEPSAFTTGSIMNQLALIYRDHPEFQQIPPMLVKALPSIERFREGDLYNFYPPRIWRGVRVHQTASMMLAPHWKGFTNVPEDADTTAVSYTARFYSEKVLKGKKLNLPPGTLKSYSRFRDLKREPHSINLEMRMVNTGAFLTWQYDENDPRRPKEFFAEPEEGKRIPFKTNDVDCIVNLNVLRLLSLTDHSNIKGRAQSCALMGYIVQSENYAKCGLYYPNTYNFHYSAALVDEAGESCMRPYGEQMVGYILKTLAADGGWYNLDNNQIGDRTHASAYALYALARFGAPGDSRVRRALADGSRFLLSRILRSQGGHLYWQGETFFTANGLGRALGSVDWKSDAFTTSIALGALLQADRALATP